MRSSLKSGAAALLLTSALCGCGGDDIDVGDVQGVVTLDGKPLPNAVVTFTPKEGGPSGVGMTDAEGKYQLLTVNENGALLGEHFVTIVCVPESVVVESYRTDDPRYEAAMKARADYKPKPVTKVPERYNTQTELTANVESGSNTFDFKLES